MTRKYRNKHSRLTTVRKNIYSQKALEGRFKLSNLLSLLHHDDCKTRTDAKYCIEKKEYTHNLHNGANKQQNVNNNSTAVLDQTAALVTEEGWRLNAFY